MTNIKKYLIDYNQKGGNYTNNNSLWIEENFFSEKEFNDILKYCSNLNFKEDIRSNNRLTLCLNPNVHKSLYKMIYSNNKLIKFINKIKNSNHYIKHNPSYPIEYRKYFTGSNGMGWHMDTSLFEPDCFEIVLTLTNTSDSRFEFLENFLVKSILPKENTLAIVRPQSILHQVTSVNYGERTILKFIIEFIEKGKNNNIKKNNFEEEISKCPY
tara:strand:- start:606 stop:1244 length:639 start_codon:yes stop_codon:yes gene_type:complete